MNSEIRVLNKKELRHFGLTTGAIVAVLFGLLLPWLFGHEFPGWPWAISLILWLWALVIPATLNSVYRGWMTVGNVLGWINTRIILGILFYVIIFPIGLGMKIFGKDPIAKNFDKNGSYRIKSKQQIKEHFERPY